jgi:dihydrolipoamide dehydrogenase
VEYTPKGITTDDNMHTNVKGIYAIGDVNGRQMLAHAATMQGIKVVNEIIGKHCDIRLDIMPAAIFTRPEAASVGMSEDMCKENGAEYICRKSFFRANGKAVTMNETEGMLKLLADCNERIVGCHVFGPHAADIVQEVSALMCRDTTLSQLADIVHIHPTLSEIVHEASMG